jgi:carbamoyltransferase
MQRKVNLKIKYREGFRPFAPSVLWEDYDKYFEGSNKSPYMLFIDYLKVERRKNLPDNFWDSGIEEKLYFLKSDLPAITHMDYSARVQSVHKETNPLFYKLISKFKEISGYSIILNTSFNVRGEPIVMTPEDAYICFMKTEMDILVMGRYIFEKEKQRNINLKHSDILTLD